MGYIQEGNAFIRYVHFNIFGYLQLPAVYLVGDLIWFPNQFLYNVIPYFRTILDKKSIQVWEVTRENYFNSLTQNIIKYI